LIPLFQFCLWHLPIVASEPLPSSFAIAAESAAPTLAGSKGGAPTDATSKALKAGSTTTTVSGITGAGAVKNKPA
jgi:hypothetical protein